MSQERIAKYNLGDIVKLNAGGPEMSVKEQLKNSLYRCQWFAGKKLDWGDFSEQSLILVREQGESVDASE